MTIQVDAAAFGLALDQFMAGKTQALRDAALDAAVRAEQHAVGLTKELKAVDLGTYKKSWYARRNGSGAEVGNSAPYAGVIEHGRRPGATKPRPEHLVEWVRRKMLVREGSKDGVHPQRYRRARKSEVYRIAERLAWAIHKRGIKPKGIMRATAARIPAFLREAVKRRLA